eukprot:Rmarinus@m.13559
MNTNGSDQTQMQGASTTLSQTGVDTHTTVPQPEGAPPPPPPAYTPTPDPREHVPSAPEHSTSSSTSDTQPTPLPPPSQPPAQPEVQPQPTSQRATPSDALYLIRALEQLRMAGISTRDPTYNTVLRLLKGEQLRFPLLTERFKAAPECVRNIDEDPLARPATNIFKPEQLRMLKLQNVFYGFLLANRVPPDELFQEAKLLYPRMEIPQSALLLQNTLMNVRARLSDCMTEMHKAFQSGDQQVVDATKKILTDVQEVEQRLLARQDAMAQPMQSYAYGTSISHFGAPTRRLASGHLPPHPSRIPMSRGFLPPHTAAADAQRRQARDQATLQERRKATERERKRLAIVEKKRRKQALRERKEFCAGFLSYYKANWRDSTHGTRKSLSAMAQTVTKFHNYRERKEINAKEKEKRERIRLLRENNEEEYRRLIKETKNERLQMLLEQTDDFLESIGAKVRSEKEKRSGSNAVVDAESNKQQLQSKTYYSIAHSVEEQITEQPKCLAGGQLKEYQLAGLQWLVSLYNNGLNGILADEMGLGKTIQTIALLCFLREKKCEKGPFLITVPLSTLPNWLMEFEKWGPSLKVVVFRGNQNVRRRIYQQEMEGREFHVVLTTYDYVLKGRNYLKRIDWGYIIVDEGHRIKNASSKLAQEFATHYTARNRLLLTGTPLQNSLSELWALLNFLLPKIFNSCEDFEQWFSAPFAAAGTEKAEIDEEEKMLIINRLHMILRPFLFRRLKSEVMDQLPEKREMILKCDLSGWQKLIYRQLKSSGLKYHDVETGKVQSRALSNIVMQLRKACNHPYLFMDEIPEVPSDEIYRASGKFEVLDRILPKLIRTKHRVLIFNQMTRVMDLLGSMFHWRGWKYLRLDGGTKAEDREEAVRTFNDPSSPYYLFLLTTRAGGLGLNLQVADTVIIFDSDWNPQMDLQAQDRAHRIGQTNEVRVYRLVTASAFEEEVLARASFKLDLEKKIIHAGKFGTEGKESDRREMLMSLLREDENDDEEGEENNSMDNDQLNSIIARTDEEELIFTRMDAERHKAAQKRWGAKGLPVPPRLMDESEAPPGFAGRGLSEAPSATLREEQLVLGRGNRRARSSTGMYRDLSDAQFEKFLEKGHLSSDDDAGDMRGSEGEEEMEEEGGTPGRASAEALREKERPANGKKRRRSSGAGPKGSGEEDEPDAADGSTFGSGAGFVDIATERKMGPGEFLSCASPPPPPPEAMTWLHVAHERRVWRALGRTLPRGQRYSGPTNAFSATGYGGDPDRLSPRQLSSRLRGVYNALLVETAKENRARYCCLLFLKLPSKKEYPDYYSVIKSPIDFDKIRKKSGERKVHVIRCICHRCVFDV